jgi:hypothetical protein
MRDSLSLLLPRTQELSLDYQHTLLSTQTNFGFQKVVTAFAVMDSSTAADVRHRMVVYVPLVLLAEVLETLRPRHCHNRYLLTSPEPPKVVVFIQLQGAAVVEVMTAMANTFVNSFVHLKDVDLGADVGSCILSRRGDQIFAKMPGKR